MMPTSQCMHSALSMPLTAAVHCVVYYQHPPFYNDLVGCLGVFSLDFLDVADRLVVKLGRDHLLLLRTLAPLLLLLISWLWRRRLKTTQAFADQLLTMGAAVLYLFPSNSASIRAHKQCPPPTVHSALNAADSWVLRVIQASIFATWQCETLTEHPDQPSFLRSDFSVECAMPSLTARIAIARIAPSQRAIAYRIESDIRASISRDLRLSLSTAARRPSTRR